MTGESATLADTDPGVDAAQVVDAKALMECNGGPVELDPETGVPKVLKRYAVLNDPPVWVVPQFLSEQEVDHLITLVEDQWVPSEVGRGTYKTNDESKDLANKVSAIRTSYSSLLKSGQTPVVKGVEKRLAQIAEMDVDYLEPLNMVRYSPGQFFKQHHDGRFRPKTVFIYLNDLPEDAAGETYFPELGMKFMPRKGCAVMWNNTLAPQTEDHRMVHQGLPPKTGVKYGVNCFFNEKTMRNLDVDCQDDRGPWNSIDPPTLVEEGETEQDGQMFTYQVLPEPEIYVTPKALQDDELSLLMRQTDGQLTEEEKQCASEKLTKVQNKLAAVADMEAKDLRVMRLTKCGVDELPNDGREVPSNIKPELPWKCVYVLLNAVAGGGQLRFPRLSLEVLPHPGCAVLLSMPGDSADLQTRKLLDHRGRPPTEGYRYIAMCCFQSAKPTS